jgi:hypothetical protein
MATSLSLFIFIRYLHSFPQLSLTLLLYKYETQHSFPTYELLMSLMMGGVFTLRHFKTSYSSYPENSPLDKAKHELDLYVGNEVHSVIILDKGCATQHSSNKEPRTPLTS